MQVILITLTMTVKVTFLNLEGISKIYFSCFFFAVTYAS